METPPDHAEYPRYKIDPRRYFGPPDVRFEAIGEAWAMIWADTGTWAVMSLLALLIGFAAQIPSQIYQASQQMGAPNNPDISMRADVFVASIVGAVASGVVSQLLYAGFFRVAILRFRGQNASVADMFQLNGMAKEVLIYATVLHGSFMLAFFPFMYMMNGALLKMVQGKADFTPFVALGCFMLLIGVIGLVVSTMLMITPAIIIDQRMPAFQAMKLSWSTLAPRFWKALGVYFCAAFLSGLGVLVCCVGLLFTLPLVYVTLAIVYRDLFIPPQPFPQPAGASQPPRPGGFEA